MTWLGRDLRANWGNPSRWVVGVWLALTVALLAFVIRHGRNAPMWEEWYDLDGIYGVTSSAEWVFGRLQQHRYVLGRALMVVVFHATGEDFRAGLVVSVGLLSAASATLLLTLQQLRGRSHFVDLGVPLLLMNPGASENLLLGYQMHFTLDVLLIAVLVRCVALADVRPPRVTAWRVGALAALLALGGWVGLAFVPGATAWVVVLAWRGGRRAALTLTLPAAACGYFAWSYLDVRRHPLVGQLDNQLPDAVRVAGEFVGLALGNSGVEWSPAAGLVVGAGTAALAAAQLAGLAQSPGRRAVAAGVLAVILALTMMAYGTGKHRAHGYAVRNIPLLAFLPILALAHFVKFGPPVGCRAERVIAAVAVLAALAIHGRGWAAAEKAASFHRAKHAMFVSDRDGGLPLEFLASRHLMFPCPEIGPGLRLLRSRGHPFARDIPDAPPYRVVPLVVPTPTPATIADDPSGKWVVGTPPVWRFAVPSPSRVAGVRVELRYPRSCERVTTQILWRKPDGTTGVSVCVPWLTPGDWTLDFWVDDVVGEFWLRPLDDADAFEVVSADLLLPQN